MKKPDAAYVVVGSPDEFQDGTPKIIEIEDVGSVGVVRWNGEYYAFRNQCPHQYGPVGRGRVHPAMHGSKAGQAELEPGPGVIVCPWHKYEYRLDSGQGLRRRQFNLEILSAELTNGEVRVWRRRNSESC